MNATGMVNVTPPMREFVARDRLPGTVLADFDDWLEWRKGYRPNG